MSQKMERTAGNYPVEKARGATLGTPSFRKLGQT